jgi:hypothetical protein
MGAGFSGVLTSSDFSVLGWLSRNQLSGFSKEGFLIGLISSFSVGAGANLGAGGLVSALGVSISASSLLGLGSLPNQRSNKGLGPFGVGDLASDRSFILFRLLSFL